MIERVCTRFLQYCNIIRGLIIYHSSFSWSLYCTCYIGHKKALLHDVIILNVWRCSFVEGLRPAASNHDVNISVTMQSHGCFGGHGIPWLMVLSVDTRKCVCSVSVSSHLLIFYLLFSFLPSRNSDAGPHSRLNSPLSTTVRAFHFYRDKTSALSSLVDSRRIEPTHARRSEQMILFC